MLKSEAKDAVVFTGTRLLNRLGSLLLLPVFWSQLSPADYGILAVITVIGAFQGLFSSVSLELAVTRFFYEWPEADRRRNLGAIWVWSWIATVLTGAAFLLVFPFLGPVLFPDVPFDPWLMLGIVANMLVELFIIPASVIRIKRMPRVFAVTHLGAFALSSALGLWFVLALEMGLYGLLLSMIWSNAVLAAVGGILMVRYSQPCLDSPGLRPALSFALPAMPSQFIRIAGSVVDRLLLSQFGSVHTLGVYAVSMKFVDVLYALHESLKMTYGPFVMRSIAADRHHGRDLVAAVTPYYIIPYLAVTLGLALFIGPVVHMIGHAEYYEVIDWVPWLAGVAFVTTLGVYYANGVYLGNRTDLMTVPAIVRLAAVVVTGLLLLPPLQLAGIVISRYVSEFAFLAISLYLSQRVFPLEHRWKVLVQLVVAAVAFGVVGEYLTIVPGPWELAINAAVWLSFLAVSWLIVAGRRWPYPGAVRRPLADWRALMQRGNSRD